MIRFFSSYLGCSRGRANRFEGGKDTAQIKEENMEPNTLLATMCGARGLYMKNKTSMEAFATVTLHGKGSLRSRASSEAVETIGDCVWDEVCEFKLSDKFSSILISVHSKSKIGSGDLIGKCEIDIEQAKQLNGTNWFRLKKKSSDEKYRGEIEMKFNFFYQKPTMSVSSTSLNHLENKHGSGIMSKMKKKIQQTKGGIKKAEDTMSMASGWSAISTKSTKSHSILNKLGIGSKDKNKSSTLPVGSFLMPSDNRLESTSVNLGSSNVMEGSGIHSTIGNKENSSFNIDDHHFKSSSNQVNTSTNANPYLDALSSSKVEDRSKYSIMSTAIAAPDSQIKNSYLQRAPSIRSNGSSGFGSTKHQKNLDSTNSQDLLAIIDSLKLELQVKDSRIKDMQQYMDNLISRVMERNPELLAAPVTEQVPKIRFY